MSSHLASSLIFLYFLTGLYGTYAMNLAVLSVAGAIGLFFLVSGAINGLTHLSTSAPRKYALLLLTGIILSTGFLISCIYNTKTDPGFSLLILANFGMTYALLRWQMSPVYAFIPFLGAAGYFLFAIVSGIGANAALAFSDASRNAVSIIMINTCTLFYISLMQRGKRLSVIPALLTAIISVWSMSRTGAVASIILLLGIMSANRANRKKYVLSSIAVVLVAGAMLLSFAPAREKIMEHFSSSDGSIKYLTVSDYAARQSMLERYVDMMNFETFIIGKYLKNTEMYDPHNSFITAHALMGIHAFFLFALILVGLVRTFFTNRVLFTLLFVLSIRAYTDSFYFFGIYEFILFYLVISAFTWERPEEAEESRPIENMETALTR